MPEIECERHHACLSVPDIRAAVDFYTDRLGFSCAVGGMTVVLLAGCWMVYGVT